MSSILKVQAGRVLNVEASTYVGPIDLLWYDETGILRLGDGVTPGGRPINFLSTSTSSSTSYTNLTPGISGTFTLGTPTQQWKSLYLSSSTFYVGGNTVTVSNTGTLFINGAPITGGGNTTIINTSTIINIISTGTSTVITGYTGSQGVQGIVGYTGSAGTGGSGTGTNNLVWLSTGTQRKLSAYIDPNGETYPVRETQLINGTFILNLAGFTPTLNAAILPSNTLNWDVPCSGFTVNVSNPTDYLDKWISSVKRLSIITGSITSDIVYYTTTGPNPTPASGNIWSQTFFTNSLGFIRPLSGSINGGVAAAKINFNYKSAGSQVETEFLDSVVTATITWNTPTLSIAMADLSGNTFLQSYQQTSYTASVTGMNSPSNYSLAITSIGGTLSNSTASGVLTFVPVLHKNNVSTSRSVSVTGTFTRPVAVTGVSYVSTLTATDNVLNAVFTYPSFWIWTPSVSQSPVRTDIISGASFSTNVNVLGNQVKNFTGTVTNSATVPRVFWFGVRSTAIQPMSFQTGASSSLLSDVAKTISGVSLFPDAPPSGYVAETYNLYGIILQPGNTYVSIS